ncbi:MAG: MHC class I heavy chain [Cereibacter sphaeroides]|uniref:MHC class I heavy chain n=1 Tax=Cereibacter sphaeroides TaxID=1063 RepID=A0A2W5SAA4_CERSP|nr:MAG: MHC class I heavy chain [Cereibacter sphaeroides]
MLPKWTTDRRIVCLTDDGEPVIVFRQRNTVPDGAPRKRYVLGNGHDVIVTEDSKFRVLGDDLVLLPTGTC